MSNPEAVPLYAIYEDGNSFKITEITAKESAADEAKARGCTVAPTDTEFAAILLHFDPDLQRKMNYDTWNVVAGGMQLAYDNYMNEDEAPGKAQMDEAFFAVTPIDLPPSIALARLDRLKEHSSPANLLAQREATEIILADRYGKPVDQNKFTEASLKSLQWEQSLMDAELGDFHEHGSSLAGELKNLSANNQALADQGLPVPKDYLVEESRIKCEMAELDLKIEEQDAMLSEPDPMGEAMAEFNNDQGDRLYGPG